MMHRQAAYHAIHAVLRESGDLGRSIAPINVRSFQACLIQHLFRRINALHIVSLCIQRDAIIAGATTDIEEDAVLVRVEIVQKLTGKKWIRSACEIVVAANDIICRCGRHGLVKWTKVRLLICHPGQG